MSLLHEFITEGEMLTTKQFSCARQHHARSQALKARWISLWQVACRAISTTTTSRAACHMMNSLLQLDLVDNAILNEFVRTFVSSIDLSGPSTLNDAAINLLATVVTSARMLNPASSSKVAESTLAWLCRNFIPSECIIPRSEYPSDQPNSQLRGQAICLGSEPLRRSSHRYTNPHMSQQTCESSCAIHTISYLALRGTGMASVRITNRPHIVSPVTSQSSS